MIRVRVPLDLHAIAIGDTAFALATPLRVRSLLALAVREAIGALAPRDKFERSLHRTERGLLDGDFALTIDGRVVRDIDAVVVCDRTVDLRFYLKRAVA